MKIQTRFSQTAAALLASAIFTASVNAAEAPALTAVRLALITNDSVVVDDGPTLLFDPIAAQCFDHMGVRMTCATLVAVGYADQANVTVSGNTVTRIDVVRMQQ